MEKNILVTVTRMKTMLQNLSGFLEKAAAHTQKFKYVDMTNVLQFRLILDQLPLVNQIQFACDTAKFVGARLSSKEAPKFEDNEKTYEEVQTRIKNTVAYLETLKESDFKGWESRKANFPWMPGKYLEAKDYFFEHAVPNFYFHVTTAYAILRANGVDLGKADYLGQLPFKND